MLSQILMTVKGLMLLTAAVYGFAALLRKEDAAWIKRGPLTVLLSMFAIGMWGHNVWVGYFALLLALPILAKSRAEAAALYCVLTVSMPVLNLQVTVGSLYLITANKYLFCALGLAIAFIARRGGTAPLRRRRFDLPMLIVLVLELAHARDASFTASLRQYTPVILTILLPYLLLSRSLNSAEDVRRFVLTFALTGFVMAAVAIVEVRLHWLVYAQIDTNLNVHRAVNIYAKMRAGMLRAPASFGDSTSLGVYLAMASMAALAMRSSFASTRNWYVALGVIVLGILFANTRGAIIGFGIGLVALDFYNRRYGALAAKFAAAGGVYLFAAVAAQFSPFFAGLTGKNADTQSTADYRVRLLHRGLEEIHKHPMLGTSLQTAMNNLEDLRQGEGIIDMVNGYIGYGLTLGYPGIIGLILVFISLCVAMLAARRKLQVNPEMIHAAAFVFSVVAFSIVGSFFGGFGGASSTPFYEVCAVGAVLWALRGVVPQQEGSGATDVPPSGIAALIAADRARAKVGAPVQT